MVPLPRSHQQTAAAAAGRASPDTRQRHSILETEHVDCSPTLLRLTLSPATCHQLAFGIVIYGGALATIDAFVVKPLTVTTLLSFATTTNVAVVIITVASFSNMHIPRYCGVRWYEILQYATRSRCIAQFATLRRTRLISFIMPRYS